MHAHVPGPPRAQVVLVVPKYFEKGGHARGKATRYRKRCLAVVQALDVVGSRGPGRIC